MPGEGKTGGIIVATGQAELGPDSPRLPEASSHGLALADRATPRPRGPTKAPRGCAPSCPWDLASPTPGAWPHIAAHIITRTSGETLLIEHVRQTAHGPTCVFAWRHRTGYNLLANSPLACVRKHLEASYWKHQDGYWPGTVAPWAVC
jgi:hypothetical protein